jgi:hypothetical protein
VHLLGKRQVSQHSAKELRQRINGALPPLTPVVGEVFALRSPDARQLLEGHTLLPGKPEGRRRGLAVRAERRGHRWAADRLLQVLLTFGNLRDASRQASRRAETLDRRHRRNPEFIQPCGEPLGKLPRERRHPRRREFLDANLDQKFSIHRQSTISISGFSRRLLPDPVFRDRNRQLPDTKDIRRTFGHADPAARIEQVEHV